MNCKDRQRHSRNTAKNWPNNFHASPLEVRASVALVFRPAGLPLPFARVDTTTLSSRVFALRRHELLLHHKRTKARGKNTAKGRATFSASVPSAFALG